MPCKFSTSEGEFVSLRTQVTCVVILDVRALQNVCTSPTSFLKTFETLQRGGPSYSKAEELRAAAWNRALGVFGVSWDTDVLFLPWKMLPVTCICKCANMQITVCSIMLVSLMLCWMSGLATGLTVLQFSGSIVHFRWTKGRMCRCSEIHFAF